jgi:hypothetical protein
VGEGGGGTGHLRVEQTFREAFDVVNFGGFSDEEAEVGIGLAEPVEFRGDGGDVELVLQLATAVFEGLVVQEDDVGLWKLFACLLGDAYVVVLVKGGADESGAVAIDDV